MSSFISSCSEINLFNFLMLLHDEEYKHMLIFLFMNLKNIGNCIENLQERIRKYIKSKYFVALQSSKLWGTLFEHISEFFVPPNRFQGFRFIAAFGVVLRQVNLQKVIQVHLLLCLGQFLWFYLLLSYFLYATVIYCQIATRLVLLWVVQGREKFATRRSFMTLFM